MAHNQWPFAAQLDGHLYALGHKREVCPLCQQSSATMSWLVLLTPSKCNYFCPFSAVVWPIIRRWKSCFLLLLKAIKWILFSVPRWWQIEQFLLPQANVCVCPLNWCAEEGGQHFIGQPGGFCVSVPAFCRSWSIRSSPPSFFIRLHVPHPIFYSLFVPVSF